MLTFTQPDCCIVDGLLSRGRDCRGERHRPGAERRWWAKGDRQRLAEEVGRGRPSIALDVGDEGACRQAVKTTLYVSASLI